MAALMPLPSPMEMVAADRRAIESGISCIELMERAGATCADLILQRYRGTCANFVVLAGPGNNGGDGFVIATKLHQAEESVVVLVLQSSSYSSDHLRERERYEREGGVLRQIAEGQCSAKSECERVLLGATIIIDALLGTGAKEAPRGVIAEIILCLTSVSLVRPNPATVIAIDIPSGINADNGSVFNPVVHADVTLAIQAPKRGMLQSPAAECCGEILPLAIGIELGDEVEFQLIISESVLKLPNRNRAAHKGEFGHVLLIAGSASMPGAARLCALAALRSGCGLVTRASWGGESEAGTEPEIMFLQLGSTDSFLVEDHLAQIERFLGKANVVVLGPGLGAATETQTAVLKLLELRKRYGTVMVIDADGLNAIAAVPEIWRGTRLLTECVLTPHPGEMARLLGISISEVEGDRYAAARLLAQQTSATVVLKGASSIIYCGTHGAVNSTGNPYMASAGSGDALSGIIAAILAQRGLRSVSMFERVSLAVYLHGMAGDLVQEQRPGPMIASDLIAKIPEAVWSCTSTKE